MGSSSIFGANNITQLLQNDMVTQDGQFISSSGTRNYIRNNMFVRNINGWVTYADAAQSTPVDGTGGTANITFTRSTTTPLRGVSQGLFTKDAANRQGQGVAYAFSIDRADRSKPLGIQFDFEVTSGTYAAGDLTVYIYDVTNSILITPSSVNIPSGTGSINVSFVSSSSASYRLILHVATTSSSAYTVGVDNFKVGPFITTMGFAGADWQSYTPTTQGLGTPSAVQMWWARSGQDVLIAGRLTSGTVAASQMQIGLPTGIAGAAALNAIGIVGKFWRSVASATNQKQGTVIVGSGDTNMFFSFDDYNAALNPATPQNASLLIGSGETIYIQARLPISQWSSNVTMADRAVEEYAATSGTWDAASSTTIYGPSGGSIGGTLTASRTKTVTFQSPIQTTDKITVEVSVDGVGWAPVNSAILGSTPIIPGVDSGGVEFSGAYWKKTGTSTIDVTFGRYANIANDDAPVSNWPGSTFWRVRKVSGGASVGFPVDASNVIGNYTNFESISSNVTLTALPPLKLVSTAAARNLPLPGPTLIRIGDAIQIKDDTGNAATNNITITADAGSTIDGAATNVIATNWASRIYIRTSATTWRII